MRFSNFERTFLEISEIDFLNFQNQKNSVGTFDWKKIIENLSTDYWEKIGQSTPKSHFSNPHNSPKYGPIPPKQKSFVWGPQGL